MRFSFSRNFVSIAVCALFVLFQGAAAQEQAIPECGRVSEDAALATQCVTRTKSTFTRVEGGWLDEDSGLVWLEETRGGVTQTEALAWCDSRDAALPTREQFELAEAHGLREVFKSIATDTEHGYRRFFWSSTAYPSWLDEISYAYGGYDGQVRGPYRRSNPAPDHDYHNVFSRCVVHPGC